MTAPYKIIDCAVPVTAKLNALKAEGITGIIRYDDSHLGPKQLYLDEYNAILNQGFDIGIIYEYNGNHAGAFSNDIGFKDASYSLKRAIERNQPERSALGFAVDYDASLSDLQNNIIPYFQGVRRALANSKYRITVYGSGQTCKVLKDKGLVDLTWITCSKGFTGTKEYLANSSQDLWQIQCEKILAGLDIDYNVAMRDDWGQWSAAGLPIIQASSVPVAIHDEKWMQQKLKDAGFYNGNIDGDVKTKTIHAMIDYMVKQEQA